MRKMTIMTKAVYEMLDDVIKAKTDDERIAALQKNDSYVLRCILRATFHPNIRFVIDEIPPYKPNDSPPEMSENNIYQEVKRIYLFEENNPLVSPNLTLDRRKQILIQILESMEAREAEVFINMLKKDLKIPGLTYEIVDKAFPGTLA
jgi:hypothetical protein